MRTKCNKGRKAYLSLPLARPLCCRALRTMMAKQKTPPYSKLPFLDLHLPPPYAACNTDWKQNWIPAGGSPALEQGSEITRPARPHLRTPKKIYVLDPRARVLQFFRGCGGQRATERGHYLRVLYFFEGFLQLLFKAFRLVFSHRNPGFSASSSLVSLSLPSSFLLIWASILSAGVSAGNWPGKAKHVQYKPETLTDEKKKNDPNVSSSEKLAAKFSLCEGTHFFAIALILPDPIFYTHS